MNEFIGEFHVVAGPNAAIVFETKSLYESSDVNLLALEGTRGVVPWGEDNDLPDKTLEIIGKNPTASACLEFKTEVAFGQGLKYGILNEDNEFVERNDIPEISSFLEDNDADGMLSEVLIDLNHFHQAYIEVVLNQDSPEKRKITQFQHLETVFCRWEKANAKGKKEHIIHSSEWSEGATKENSSVIKALDARRTLIDLEQRTGRRPGPDLKTKDLKQYKFAIPVHLSSPGKKYYPRPSWYSLIEGKWMAYANSIPEFKMAMMNNSMTVIYHVEINRAYFDRIFKEENLTEMEKKKARIKTEYTNIEKFLKGEKNAGKSFITYFRYNEHNEKIEEKDILITVIDRKIGGEYLEDSQESTAMIFTGMREHPSLVGGVIPGKSGGNLSGSDKRELLRIKQTLQARIRSRIFKILNVIKKFNKWPDEIVFRIPDLILNTLDEKEEVTKITE